ncbi:hypothetical protein E2C01_091978 [Portunus trituberculatus]|uniref:Uncharacterized protein n=1 Tax=Portunus trituberculatus TaxID=210409 RepID=A0A5B7JQI5_PORTR|nr:hypothetical protein [Portunus trituberculatus]
MYQWPGIKDNIVIPAGTHITATHTQAYSDLVAKLSTSPTTGFIASDAQPTKVTSRDITLPRAPRKSHPTSHSSSVPHGLAKAGAVLHSTTKILLALKILTALHL